MALKTSDVKVLSQEEHILTRPDTYVGAVEITEKEFFVVKDIKNLDKPKIEKKTVKYIPAFVKIFDEVLTNASDHVQRGGNVKNIKVNITSDWKITVWNDGSGIPIEKHKQYDKYVPEIIFGTLLSGSNFNDNEERYGAGRNGLGAKLTNLFSKKFIVDCADGKKSFYQEYDNNMSIKSTPKIKSHSKSYTEITYIPDLKRLPADKCAEDTMKVIVKRVIDIAAYNPKVKVWLNDKLINIQSVKDWAEMHINEGAELFTEKLNDKWEIALSASSKDSFEQTSIVNGNSTWIGGTHVDYIMGNIVKRLTEDLTRGNKGIKIKSQDIKSKFLLFLICKIPNPTFDTQTKENMTLKMKDEFTKNCDLSDKLYKQLMKSEIIENILNWVQMKEQMELNKMNKKAAGKTIRIDKLVDAHKAGTSDGWKCALALSEGDSAKNTVVSGLSVVGRDYWGVFPLKGKPLNVRDAVISKITQNDEISKILQIIGLVPGKKYTSVAELRYGKIVFFTDADTDGVHIKGLLINLIHKMWPELLQLGFCYEFITPIVIAKKNKDKKEYYNLSNYIEDKKKGKLDGYTIKYYKGLGTIQSDEIKEMFKNIDKHLIRFNYVESRDNDDIDMLFNKTRVQNRKDWLLTYKGEIVPEKFGKPNQIKDFIDNEFIQFSTADNIRSIPNIMDGLKPSQRKIIYAAFKRNGLKDEIKVAQFGAYAAEVSSFHHGENSMMTSIVSMAQDFIGTNNINLLEPKGQFGTRLNPDGHASPRYIFTKMNPLTNLIYRKEDETILNYLNDDGQPIEPEYYLPIIPMVLVNGAVGIGTGWSTDIPKYDPDALIKVIKKKIEKPVVKYRINPWYKDFLGDIEWNDEKQCYTSKGVFERTKRGIIITELPIDVWTEKYVGFLDTLCDNKVIKNYIDNSTDKHVNIEVIFNDDMIDEQIYSNLKLTTNISINNIHTFVGTKIVKWESVEQLLNYWFDIRLKAYETRKNAWVAVLKDQLSKLNNLHRFILAVIDEEIVINNRKRDVIVKDLEKGKFDKVNDSFDYLLNIPIYNFTKEKVDEIKEKLKDKKEELKEYSAMTPGQIWIKDLEELEKGLKSAGY